MKKPLTFGVVHRLVLVLSGTPLVLGLIMMMSWLSNSTGWVATHYEQSALSLTIAVCFALSGIAVWSLHQRHTIPAQLVSILMLVTMVFLLAYEQNIADVTYSEHSDKTALEALNQKFVPLYLLMSFLLIAASVISLSWVEKGKFPLYFSTICAALLLIIMLATLLKFAFGIQVVEGTSLLTGFQVAASIALFGLGLAILLICHTKITNNYTKPMHYAVLVGGVFLGVTLLTTKAALEVSHNRLTDYEQNNLKALENRLSEDWSKLLISLYASKDLQQNLKKVQKIRQDFPFLVGLYRQEEDDSFITISPVKSNTGTAILTPDIVFTPQITGNLSAIADIECSEVVIVDNRPLLISRKPLSYSPIGSVSKLVFVIDLKRWLETIYLDKFANTLSLRLQVNKTQLARWGEFSAHFNKHNVDLPIEISNAKVLVGFNHTLMLNTFHWLPQSVFLLGLVLSLGAGAVCYSSLLARQQTRTLRKQMLLREESQIALQRSHAQIKLATDVAKLGIWQWDTATDQLVWNDIMYDIYETPHTLKDDSLLYQNWYERVHPDDREATVESLQKAVDKRSSWRADFRLLMQDGRIKYLIATAVCMTDAKTGSIIVVGGNLDITNERKIQGELEEKTALAEQNSMAKSQFLANMSHEIRTPMNGILGMGELLEGTSLSSKQRNYLTLMMSSADSLLRLLNDILDLSKIEAGQMRLDIVCVPLEETLVDTLKALSASAHEKQLDYHFSCESNVPLWVYTDPIRLSQIMVNLVGNAIKFTETGEILVTVRRDDEQDQGRNYCLIQIEVADTGIGISKEKLNAIFAPFTQEDATTTRRFGGTGLGLAIVKELVEMLEGVITIDSEPGKGTKFKLVLPMRLGDAESSPENLSATYKRFLKDSKTELTTRHVMVVDDNDVNRQWLTEMLHSWGCNVSKAQTAKEALEKFEENFNRNKHTDLLIVDKNMPKVDGIECLERLNAFCEEQFISMPPCILLTRADSKLEEKSQAYRLNVKDHLIKPVKQSEVFNSLMAALGAYDSQTQSRQEISKVSDAESLKILVAEDHEVNQYLIEEVLSKRGHKVTLVENGRLALEALHMADYDAIVMDVQMPVMDGLEATKQIRKGRHQADIFIVGLTARALKEDAKICLDAGMNAYLTKPLDIALLLHTLESRDIKASVDPEKELLELQQDSPPETEVAPQKMFDLEQAMLTTGNDKNLMLKMADMTLSHIGPLVEQLETLYAKQDWTEFALILHKTRGMCSNLSSEDLTEQMDKLYELATEKDVAGLQAHWPKVSGNLQLFSTELGQVIHRA